ncbi:cysteine desulfurase [Candidatus Woesearchaeota archaeon]|nr:cysteine desulfurase [Candidatus Woesearchaeota archaeon]
MIYLDHASATPLDPGVQEEMQPYFIKVFGNPGSPHRLGLDAKNALDALRQSTASVLSCHPEEIIFTSGGTESINLAIQGIAHWFKRGHIITSSAEHEAVLETCRQLEREGFSVTYLEVDRYGMVSPLLFERAFRQDTILSSIIYANNEVGTINSIQELASIARHHNVLFHTDACQAGLLDLHTGRLGVDLLSLNGSKINGPKGVGLLYHRSDCPLQPLLFGGGQENGKRSGTENLPLIAGFVKALEVTQAEKEEEMQRLKKIQSTIISGILSRVPNCQLNGHPTQRLPSNVSISFRDIEAEQLIEELDKQGIYVAAGSACTSKSLEPSHVLKAMKVPLEYAQGTIRFSFGKTTSEEEIETLLRVMPPIIEVLRKNQIIISNHR